MLKTLRKQKVAKKIFYLLAITIIPAFVLWGSYTAISNKGNNKGKAGKIFGKTISYQEYAQELYAWQTQLKIKFGDKAKQIEKLFNANLEVWNRLILNYETKKRKIRISDNELTKYITSLPFLQKDGIFDPQLYELFLRYALAATPRIFEEQMRQSLMLQKLFDQTTDDINISGEEIKEAYTQQNKQIKVKYIDVLAKDFEDKADVGEEEIEKYYQDNQKNLTMPIQINLNYLGFDYPKEATDEQKQSINDKAKQLKHFLDNNNELSKAETEFSLTTKETGFFSLGEPVPEFGWTANYRELFNLKENERTDIIKAERGPYIFQLKENRTNYLPSLDEVKQKIKDKLTQEKTRQLAKTEIDSIYEQIKRIKEKNADLGFVPSSKGLGRTVPSGLAQVAEQLNLSLKETDFFSRQSPVSGIETSMQFNEAAFKLKDKELSQVIDAGNDFYIIELLEEKPIDEKEFEKQKEELKQSLLQEKKNKAFEEFFANLKTKANLVDYIQTGQAKEPLQKE